MTKSIQVELYLYKPGHTSRCVARWWNDIRFFSLISISNHAERKMLHRYVYATCICIHIKYSIVHHIIHHQLHSLNYVGRQFAELFAARPGFEYRTCTDIFWTLICLLSVQGLCVFSLESSECLFQICNLCLCLKQASSGVSRNATVRHTVHNFRPISHGFKYHIAKAPCCLWVGNSKSWKFMKIQIVQSAKSDLKLSSIISNMQESCNVMKISDASVYNSCIPRSCVMQIPKVWIGSWRVYLLSNTYDTQA